MSASVCDFLLCAFSRVWRCANDIERHWLAESNNESECKMKANICQVYMSGGIIFREEFLDPSIHKTPTEKT